MKLNIKNMICGLGLMVLATSCDNFLDVHPKGEIVGKDLLSERKGFENALYGFMLPCAMTKLMALI